MQSQTCETDSQITAPTMPLEWRGRAAAHHARVGRYAEDFLARRAKGEKHPVWDFLFTYYSFSPGKLMTWMPPMLDAGDWSLDTSRWMLDSESGQNLTAAETESQSHSQDCSASVIRHPASSDQHPAASYQHPPLPDRVRRESKWVAQLCENMLGRPARFVCHGLHEWAMVYKQSAQEVRHSGYELRMAPETLAAFVESQTICCTHHDAFRFYTPAARPLNTLQPRFETRLEMEQGGCLHANMDLYKWAYKLWPWIGSDLVADAFEVALAGRIMDMRASPYDLAALGFEPIRIETEEGRAEYRAEQRRIATLAEPVRLKLKAAAERLATSTPQV